MKKAELHDLVLETVNEYINEAELKTGDNEFTIKVDVSARELKKKALEYNIFINDIKFNEDDNYIQICLTEKRTKDEIDQLISFFKNHANN